MNGEKFDQREADATMSPLSPQINKGAHGSVSLAVIQDKSDWTFDPCLFREFDQCFGPHTLDAAAASDGSNAQLLRFCLESDSFLQKELAEEERVWMNPPYNNVHLFLLHYLEEKNRKPSITGTFFLPKWPSTKWYNLTRRFCKVAEYPKGTQLFTAPDPDRPGVRRAVGPAPWPVEIWRDEHP